MFCARALCQNTKNIAKMVRSAPFQCMDFIGSLNRKWLAVNRPISEKPENANMAIGLTPYRANPLPKTPKTNKATNMKYWAGLGREY